MRLALAAGGALLLALLTWLLLRGIDTNASAYAETQRAFDDFALAEASIGRDVLRARAGLLGNYDVLAEAEEAMESAASRIRLHVEAENLDPKPVEALAAAVGQYEDLIERFKTGNSLLQNSLSYVGQLSTDPAFGALGDQFAPSATALAAAVLRLARDSSPESAKSLQEHVNRFEAQAPTGGLEGEAAHALLAHARLLSDLLPEVDQTLRALVAAPGRQPFEETRELLARAQAAFEVTAQRFRILLYAVSLGLLVIALRLGQRLWTRTLRIRRLVDANIIGIFIWDLEGRVIQANDAFLHLVGYDRGDLASGRVRWSDRTPAEWRERDEHALAELHSTQTVRPYEKVLFRKDGSRVSVLIGGALFEEGGSEGVAFVLDLTERKRAEEALRESEYRLRQIIETVPGLLWSNGPDGEPTHVSQRMLDYSGMPFEDFKHRGWEAFVHPADFPETAKAFYHAIQTGTSYEGVMRLRQADSEFRWHHARCEPLRDRQGRVIQWYGLSVDIDERKKAEDQLRRSEAHLAEAQKLSHTGSAEYNGTTILYWSDETYRIMEFDPRKGLPTREASHQRIHSDDRERVRKEARRAEQNKKDYTLEYRIVLPAGTIKHIELSAHPKFSVSGEPVEVVSTLVDVTERKRAEEALRESEAKFRDFAETASDWFWEIGPDYKFTLLTENAFGSHSADRIGTPCWDHALDLETEPEKWRLVWATLDSRKPFRDFVYCSMRGDGTPMYVRISGRPVFEANGEFQGYRGTGTDVTAIMRAHEALRESERNLRSAIDGIAGLVAVLAPNGELETVNRQLLEFFGRPLEWIKNWGTNDAVHPEDLPRALELFKRGMASGIPFNFEVRLRCIDGEYRRFENRGVPVRDDSGRIARWYCLLTDIEDRTRALARLEQMQSDFAHMNRVSMMGELTASLAHEITQPIATARNNARAALNFLDRQPPELREVKEALACVVGDADRAGEIIDRIRDHIRKAPPRKARFDLSNAIDEVIVLGRSAITKNGVLVQTLLAEGVFPVQGDRVQLQQVILNLVLNAVEAMGAVEAGPRELLISTEQTEANGILVAVRDSGPGIDPEHVERVFEAFYTTKSSGVGMGLSICRSIIDAHGGRLWADANEPRGAVFQFTLPGAENELTNGEPREGAV
jgi:PAS domain S-box-containing protein